MLGLRTSSVDDVFAVLGASVDPRHLCQTVVSLWDVHKLNENPGPLPAADFSRLMEALRRRADSCDDLALVCALYWSVPLPIKSRWNHARTVSNSMISSL